MNRLFTALPSVLALVLFPLFSHAENAGYTENTGYTENIGIDSEGAEQGREEGQEQGHVSGSNARNGDVAGALLQIAFWQSVEYSNIPAELEAYLEEYPNGVFVELARSKLENPDNFKDLDFHGMDYGMDTGEISNSLSPVYYDDEYLSIVGFLSLLVLGAAVAGATVAFVIIYLIFRVSHSWKKADS